MLPTLLQALKPLMRLIRKGRPRCAPGNEAMPEPNNDEAMVYEDFFVTGLCMPPHPTLADILLHFQVQLHQLTPNTIAQL
jgi:hypothetical protein